MSVNNYKELHKHKGHNIMCVSYGNDEINISLECKDCNEVLIDFNKDDEEDY